jgi:Tol biopolymer transport system component
MTMRAKTRTGQIAAETAAMMLATDSPLVLALAGSAEATFPGNNGVIAFESNRTTGKGVHNPTEGTEIFTVEPDGRGLAQLTHNKAEGFSPAFSPDGRCIAFTTGRDGDYFEIYKMNADGSYQRNLTDNRVDNFNPDFLPDGRHIAFTPGRDGNAEIYVMGTEGSNPRNLTNAPADDSDPSYSPDGKRIAFQTRRDGNFDLNADEVDGKSVGEIGMNGLERVSTVSATNESGSPKFATANCPTGKVVVGTGYDFFGGKNGSLPNGQTDVVINTLLPSSTFVAVEAYEEEPTSINWHVTAYAMCAKVQ